MVRTLCGRSCGVPGNSSPFLYGSDLCGVWRIFGRSAYVRKRRRGFPADDGYIRAYQHLATDEELIDSLVTYLDRTNQYLEKQGIPFVFLAGLDKKTVYGEEMPDYIHVDTTKESFMEMLARKLTEKQVPYVIPVQELRDAKQVERVYNQKYDSAHWNARGAMIGLRLLNEKVREMDPDVPLLTEDVFTASSEEKHWNLYRSRSRNGFRSTC